MSETPFVDGTADPLARARVAVRPHGAGAGSVRILLAATLRWPIAARLAIALRRLGCEVHAWCPPGHPLTVTRAVARIHAGHGAAPRSLLAAIGAASPNLVVPCDDAAALQLCALHARPARALPGMGALLERSLGTPASYALATDRGELMRLALAHGVRVPATARLSVPADVDAWAAQNAFPAVVKVDGSWGGLGVEIVGDLAGAQAAFRRAMHPPLGPALAHWLLRRDAVPLRRRFARARPAVTIQAFVAGRTANRAVACWQGEVLAGISVVALESQTATGPASVVRVIDHPEIEEASRRVVRALGLSGLCGFDFIVAAGGGGAHLIEVNPRATPICHLALGSGRDLPAALIAHLLGERGVATAAAGGGETIALFPGEWRRNPQSPYLQTAFHDVPWAEAALVRDGIGLPWEERGLLARLRAALAPERLSSAARPEIRLARGAPPG